MFEAQTEGAILTRLKSGVTTGVDTREGSFVHDVQAPAATELADGYSMLDYMLEMLFAQTATGEYLEKRAGEFGLTRVAGAKAQGRVKFTGSVGVVVPAGVAVVTSSGLGFTTLEAVTLTAGTGEALVEADDIGVLYNVGAGMLSILPVAVLGVSEVTNEDAVSGGADEETDEELRYRLLFAARTAPTSGNASHYVMWALEVVGVGRVKVFPLWDGNGTVKVVLVGDDGRAVSEAVRAAAAAYIEQNRPIGADVTVESASEKAINMALSLTTKPGYTSEQVQANIIANVDAYLKDIAFKQDYVSYTAVNGLIYNTAGVLDFSGLLVNGGMSNVPLSNTAALAEVAVPGSLTLV